jgi:hypothetical protein
MTKTYHIQNLSKSKLEKLRLACRKQYLEDCFRKNNSTTVLEAVTGNIKPIVEKYKKKGYRLSDDFGNSSHQHLHLLVFEKER